MKLEISLDKIINLIKSKAKTIIAILFVLFLISMAVATYFALAPGSDKAVMQEATKKKQELNINFDKRALQELNNKKSPAIINEAGGRNPFMPY